MHVINTLIHIVKSDILPITYPCCVLTEVTTFVFYTVGVSNPLEKLHLLYYVLPFLLEQDAGSMY